MKLDEKAIKWIIREKEKGTPTKEIAEIEGITPRRVNQIYRQYKETGEVPKPKKLGRPKKELSKEEIEAIKEAYEEYRCNALCKRRKEQKEEKEMGTLRKKTLYEFMAYRLVLL